MMFRQQFLAARAFLGSRCLTKFFGMFLLINSLASVAGAQSTNYDPADRPKAALINLKMGDPHQIYNGRTNVLLRITSLTGSPILIAQPGGHAGWAGITSSGKECPGNRMEAPAMPSVDRDGRLSGSSGFTAGINAPALVPLSLYCDIQRDEELSINLIFFVEANGRWLPQHFSFQQQRVK